MEQTSVRQAGIIIFTTAVLGKVVGFMREAVIAAIYGTSYAVDVYLAGLTLPAMAVTIAFHAVPNAFIPLFSDPGPHQQARRQAWKLLGAASLLSCGMWWLAAPIASLTNTGFPEALRSETVEVLRIGSPTVALATAEALLRSRLLASKRFIRPGLSVVFYSALVVIAIWLYPDGGPRTLAWGTVGGTAASALCNLTPIEFVRNRTRRIPESTTTSSLPHRIGLWVPVVLFIDTIPQFYQVIDRSLASHLGEGSIAALHYASLIAVVPTSICGLALGTAVFPYLSQAMQVGDVPRASEILDRAIALSLIVTIPIMIWLVFLSEDVTSLLYERGAFDQASRLLTGWTLLAYALGLTANALMIILSKVFYSSRRWRPILLSSCLGLSLKAALSFWLVASHGAVGLAMASTTASLAGAMYLLLALPRAFTTRRWQRWAHNALVLSAISGLCTVAAVALVRLLPIDSQAFSAFSKVACAVLLTGIALYATAPRVGLREIDVLRQTIAGLKIPLLKRAPQDRC